MTFDAFDIIKAEADYARSYIEWSLSSFSPYVLAEPYSTHDLANIVINNFMHFWGHRMIYTRSTLGSMLRNAGFEEVSFSSVGKSRHLPLQNLERHGQSIEPAGFILTHAYALRCRISLTHRALPSQCIFKLNYIKLRHTLLQVSQ